MDKHKILHLIDEPQRISEADLERLEDIVASYPYFQVAHLLIAKYTQDKESMLAPQKIRRAASYALDRNQLRKFILASPTNGDATLKLKTHFEAIDDHTPKLESTFEKTEDVSTLPSKEIPTENKEVSFFDVIESQESAVESSSQQQEDNQENINEAYAMECFHNGKVAEAEGIFKQLVLLNPEKASYYYKQLAVLTEKEEYLQLAQAHQPAEEKAAQPFFENIPEASLSETETLISQAVEPPTESTSFFEGITPSQEEESPTTTEELSSQFIDNTTEDESSEIEDWADEVVSDDAVPPSFFDQVEAQDSVAKDLNTTLVEGVSQTTDEVDEFDIQSLISTEIRPTNQATEDEESFFAELAAIEDIHAVERTPETDPFEELRKEAKAPQTEEPFEIKPEPKPDLSFFDALEEQDVPPTRTTTENTPQEDPTETQAIYIFNQGRNKEAIEIYEKLLEKNPQKASYYLSQINVIKSFESDAKQVPKTPTSHTAQPSTQEKEKIENNANEPELNERLAIQLFNDGKLEEAIEVYNQLKAKEKREDKIAYYDQQIAILKS